MSERRLIVGLGNPGRMYERTRHNVGWFVLDELARRHDLQFSGSAHGARLAEGRIRGHAVILAKPQGYMNRSGQPTGSLLRYWRIERERLLVVLDDLDQPAGTLRIRPAAVRAGSADCRTSSISWARAISVGYAWGSGGHPVAWSRAPGC